MSLPLEITVTELKSWLDEGRALRLLDVREDWEWNLCRIEGATHIPLGQLPAQLSKIATDCDWVVYCHHGGRSLRAVQWLRSQGIEFTTNLKGGVDAWALQIDPQLPTY